MKNIGKLSGGPDSFCFDSSRPIKLIGISLRNDLMLSRDALHFSPHAPKKRPALRPSVTKNLRFTSFHFQDFQRLQKPDRVIVAEHST
jgi:hypothetical protein